MKLVCFDMDGVIFKHHNFWMELHREYGTLEEGIELTKKYVETDYSRLVKEVIGRLWAGKPAKFYFDLINRHEYVKGAGKTFKKIKERKDKTMIISSGPYDLALRAQRDLGVDYVFTNRLSIKDGKIVGTDEMNYWRIKYDSKIEPLEEVKEELGLNGRNVIAIIHDKNDIKLARHIREIGGKVIGFMFEPHEEVEKECTTIVRSDDLSDILEHI